ncbi:DUF488 family protein [Paeniglutamicibacter sp. MACA_103]|uniref:DUF488 family protein n=1 Tax=Paeniglutamicibacter sp. MACA_103 TaxID=3377337 RepID=UPI00389632F5
MGTTRIHTVGHSTHEVAEFIEILRAHGIGQVIDIRTIPKSRHNPQFNGEELAASLEAADIGYRRAKELGGLRPTHKDSINGGWHNDSFRGYADYMQGDEFAAAIGDLVARAAGNDTAIMCAEAVPWRCHRSLIGDALMVRGVEVLHIISRSTAMPHTLTSFARVEGTALTYPPTPQDPGPGQP